MQENDQEGDKPAATAPLKETLIRGSLWMIAMRWTMRFLSIISVSVLARLLEKEDFGLMAMASALMALPLVFLDMGISQALIREKNASRDYYNTAWTMRVLQMLLVAVLVYLAAPFAADYYGDERIAEIFRILSVVVFLQGLENIWVTAFLKNFTFHRDFIYNAVLKLLSVIITIVLAFALQSYWALVYGQIAGNILRLLLSFTWAPERPRPTLVEWRKIWAFSQWSLLRGAAVYIMQQSDKLILGRLAAPALVGAYSVGREIAEMSITEISAPLNRALGPGFSELQDEPQRLASALKKTLAAVACVSLPVSLGMAVTAEQLIPVALGPGWETTIPIFQVLVFSAVIITVHSVLSNMLVVIGYVSHSTVSAWVRALAMIAVGVPGTAMAGPMGMACALVASGVAGLLFVLYSMCWRLKIVTLGSLVESIVRPLLAVVVMVPCVLAWDLGGIGSDIVLLICKVLTGIVVYTGVLLSAWHVAGRPDGLEHTILQAAISAGRRALRKVRPAL